MFWDTDTSLLYSLQLTTCGALLRNSSSLNGLSQIKQTKKSKSKPWFNRFRNKRTNKKKKALVPATKKDLNVNAFLFLVATGHFWIRDEKAKRERERKRDRTVKITEMRNGSSLLSLWFFLFIFFLNVFVCVFLSLSLFHLLSEIFGNRAGLTTFEIWIFMSRSLSLSVWWISTALRSRLRIWTVSILIMFTILPLVVFRNADLNPF